MIFVRRVFQISVWHVGRKRFPGIAFCLEYSADLLACVLGIELVEDVDERCHVVIHLICAVHTVIDGDKADIVVREHHLRVHTDLKIITPETAHILDDDRADLSLVDERNEPSPIGTVEVRAGLNISNALCNLMNVVFIALGHAVGIIIGQMLGAKEFEKAKRNSISLMWFSGIVCVLLSVILSIIAGWFPSNYETSDYVRNCATTFIIITALFFPLQGFLNSLYFTLRSGGKTLVTFLFDSVFSWVVGVSTAFILSTYTNVGIFGIYFAVQAVDFVKVIIGYILIQKGVWITNIVAKNETTDV